jgi:hypothetical protein
MIKTFKPLLKVKETQMRTLTLLTIFLLVTAFVQAAESDKDLNGYEIVLQYHQNKFQYDWRMQHYPFAGNSENCYVTPMRYCGIPGMLMYKPRICQRCCFTRLTAGAIIATRQLRPEHRTQTNSSPT